MPNWCSNYLEISHKRKMPKALAAWNEGKFLETLIPMPKALNVTHGCLGPKDSPEQIKLLAAMKKNMEKYGYESWYKWRLDHWGTKWDIGRDIDDDLVELHNNTLRVSFDSAWSPPVKAYEKLYHAGFVIKAFYFEPGVGFCGEFVDGQDYEYSCEDAPQNIAELFGIREMQSV